VLSPDELGISIVIPQNSPFGTNRPVVGREYPTVEPLMVDGVRVDVMAEFYIGNPPNLGLVAHELSHLLLGATDMYFGFGNPFAAGDYSLMDRTYKTTHLDPFHKLKLGWLRPKIIFRGGRYTLRDVEESHDVWILLDPARGSDEYFIVENRWPGDSYDRHMADAGGLAVWHIIENPSIYGSSIPPRRLV
jgi:M6 family metalloprotease-like protein